MKKVIVFGIILMSLIPWVTSFVLHRHNYLIRERSKVMIGIIQFWIILFVTFLLFRRYYTKIDPFMYVFSLYCSDALCSLAVALEMDGYSLTNITTVKPCLKTAHGAMLFYWNGTVHYLLCIVAVALYTRRESHREVSFYWAGSLMNSMIVILPVCLAGANTENVSTFLNVTYAVLSIVVILYYIERRPFQSRIFYMHEPLWKRRVDLLFLLYFLAATVLAIFRGLAVLDGQASWLKNYAEVYEPYLRDKSNFPKFQALTYEYLFIVYYLATVYGLTSPGQYWMADGALIHAGAAAQAQFTYICGSIHHLTPKENYPPKTGIPAFVFWTVNVSLFIVPQVFAWWCQRNPEHFGLTYTEDLAIPCSIHTSKYSKRTE